jgi:hypothetical protein
MYSLCPRLIAVNQHYFFVHLRQSNCNRGSSLLHTNPNCGSMIFVWDFNLTVSLSMQLVICIPGAIGSKNCLGYVGHGRYGVWFKRWPYQTCSIILLPLHIPICHLSAAVIHANYHCKLPL